MNENYKVYIHRFPNGKVYVGITSKEPEKRWLNGRGYQTQYVYKPILKYGWDSIEHIVLFSGLSKEQAEKKEIETIALFDSTNPNKGYNVEFGGKCPDGRSEVTKQKISDARKGWNPSKETRDRMSQSKKGKKWTDAQKKALQNRHGHPLSEKQRKALAESNRNRIISEETRKKQSDSHKGKTLSEEQKRKISESGKIAQRIVKAVSVAQYDLSGKLVKVWDCMTDITTETGIGQPHICQCCKGSRKTAGGYRWEYANK